MNIPIPGPGRLTLIALAIVPAAMTYPWRTDTERWVLGVGAVVAVLLLAWWRGRYLTDVLWRRLAMSAGSDRDEHPSAVVRSGIDARTTVVLRLLDDGPERVLVRDDPGARRGSVRRRGG